MVTPDDGSMPGSVGERLLDLVSGAHPKSTWVRGGAFVTAIAAGLVAPYLGWRPYRLRLILAVSAVWFLIALVIAFRDSENS